MLSIFVYLECLENTNVDLALVHAVVVILVLLRRAVRLAVALQPQVAVEQLEAAKNDLFLCQFFRVHLALVLHCVGVQKIWRHWEGLIFSFV